MAELIIHGSSLFAFALTVATILKDKSGFAEAALPRIEPQPLQDELLKETILFHTPSL
ncbi:hypothetical protein [Granulicella arctica]|uniref:Uncharacterized protein n=1 Tax=Granulicella arctica TaxID=940613 RepID=A0A7Y9PDH1_9BACT|nr:hypothetical protein [Granulicella arctica]NYF77918.1 hypothetical protein [Granulicella arctica]